MNKQESVEFVTTLKMLRESRGLTLQQVADHLGIDDSFVSRLERGKRRLSLDRAARLADLYGVTLKDVFDLTRFNQDQGE